MSSILYPSVRRRALILTALTCALLAAAGTNARGQAPQVFEDFSSFPGLTGVATDTALSDYGTGLYLIVATSTGAGFASVAGPGQPAPNLALGYDSLNETGFVITDSSFTPAFTSTSHMLAMRFRYSGTTATNSRGPIIIMYQQGASFPCYVMRAGTDGSNVFGVSPTITTGGTPGAPTYGSFGSTAAAEGAWHTLIVQYQNSTTTATNNGAITWWVNPVTTASPGSTFTTVITSTGTTPVSDWGLRGNFFSANLGRPTSIEIDTIGIWDGFGTAGVNDLQAGLDFLAAAVPVELSGFSLD